MPPAAVISSPTHISIIRLGRYRPIGRTPAGRATRFNPKPSPQLAHPQQPGAVGQLSRRESKAQHLGIALHVRPLGDTPASHRLGGTGWKVSLAGIPCNHDIQAVFALLHLFCRIQAETIVLLQVPLNGMMGSFSDCGRNPPIR
jgi:hypothetical protein